MKRTSLFVAALLTCTGGAALAQDKKPDPKPATPAVQPAAKPGDKPAGQPSEAEMMKMWEQMNAPGENHKLLQKTVGTWSAQVKSWWAPGGPADESTGISTVTSDMDGRFTKVDFKGTMGGKPFTGTGHYGYNNATKKFEGVWIDSMSTGMMTSTGTYDPAKKQFTYISKMVDPMDGQEKTIRTVEKIIDDNSMVMEMYCPGPDGKEFKNLEITYARTGGVKPAPAVRDPKPVAPAKK